MGNTETLFKPISEKEKWLTGQIVGIAIDIHKKTGPGLQAGVYEKCFCHEMEKRNIPFVRDKIFKIMYEGLTIDEGVKINILADDLIIIEIKAQENFQPVWEAQLLGYLKLTGKRLGYILNFHVPLMKDGIKRMIYN